jgi:hypothetical protein
MMRAPTARGEDVVEPLRIEARPHAQHHGFRRHHHVAHRHHVVHDLEDLPRAERADVVDLVAEHAQERTAALEHVRLAADEEDQLAAPRVGGATAHRRVEALHPLRFGGLGHLAPALGIGGAHVNEGHARPRAGDGAVGGPIGAPHRGHVGQARQHHVGGLGDAGR